MKYGVLLKAIEYFEDEKLKSSGDKFEMVSTALEAMTLVKKVFEQTKEA